MSWGLVAAGFVSMGTSMLSNAEQADRYSAMSRWRKFYGELNAKNTWDAANAYARLIEGMGQYNAAMEWMTAEYQADAVMSKAEYNMTLSAYTSEYNAQQEEKTAQEIWQQLDLDLHWLHMARASERAEAVTSYAYSGVELNSMDTPEQTMMDSKVMEELDATIMTRNADIKAGAALDAAAMSRWEGRIVRQQISYEATMAAATTMMNAMTRASSIALQSHMDGMMTRFNAANQADSLLYDAYYDAASYTVSERYHRSWMRGVEGFLGSGGAAAFGNFGAEGGE